MTTRGSTDPARGGKGKWESDLGALSKQYSVRDLPSHTKLKYRQEGQGRPEEVQGRDLLKRELEEKEKRAVTERTSGRSAASSGAVAITSAGDKRTSSSSGAVGASTKRARTEAGGGGSALAFSSAVTNLDADDPWDEDGEEEAAESGRKRGLVADSSEEDTSEEDEDDFDPEQLQAELNKLKREREEERSKQAAEKKTADETIRMETILKGNPLLNMGSGEFKVKRRWDDDVVFKNCARGEVDHAKRGFINDSLRSEFHKKFMRKYIQ